MRDSYTLHHFDNRTGLAHGYDSGVYFLRVAGKSRKAYRYLLCDERGNALNETRYRHDADYPGILVRCRN